MRSVVPIALSTRNGFWYLSGVDQEIQEIRTFRVDRINSAIAASAGPKGFQTPTGFDPSKSLLESPTQSYAFVQEPAELRDLVVNHLESLVKNHG
jgi:proteasome accessory factor B